MAARQLWMFLTEHDVASLVQTLEARDPGVRASYGRYLRGDPRALIDNPASLERRESLPGERRLYLFHSRFSTDVVVHPQPAGPFAGWSQIDEERSDCLVLHLPTAPAGELHPARLQAWVVSWRVDEKIRKKPRFSIWAGQSIKALLAGHPPTAVSFMHIGQGALSQARAGTLRLTYLYRPIGPVPLPKGAKQPPPAGAITEENPAPDDDPEAALPEAASPSPASSSALSGSSGFSEPSASVPSEPPAS